MFLTDSDRIFDTLIDTQRKRVSMKTKFYLRKDIDVNGKNPIYLRISGNNEPVERIHTFIYVDAKIWHAKNQRVFSQSNTENDDTNLLLRNIESKLTAIETVFRLSGTTLTPKIMRDEYENKLSRVNFMAFSKSNSGTTSIC